MGSVLSVSNPDPVVLQKTERKRRVRDPVHENGNDGADGAVDEAGRFRRRKSKRARVHENNVDSEIAVVEFLDNRTLPAGNTFNDISPSSSTTPPSEANSRRTLRAKKIVKKPEDWESIKYKDTALCELILCGQMEFKDLELLLSPVRCSAIRRLLHKFDQLFNSDDEGGNCPRSERKIPSDHEIAEMIVHGELEGFELEGLLSPIRVSRIRKLAQEQKLVNIPAAPLTARVPKSASRDIANVDNGSVSGTKSYRRLRTSEIKVQLPLNWESIKYNSPLVCELVLAGEINEADLDIIMSTTCCNSVRRLLKKFDALFGDDTTTRRTIPTDNDIATMIANKDMEGNQLEGLLPPLRVASIRKLAHEMKEGRSKGAAKCNDETHSQDNPFDAEAFFDTDITGSSEDQEKAKSDKTLSSPAISNAAASRSSVHITPESADPSRNDLLHRFRSRSRVELPKNWNDIKHNNPALCDLVLTGSVELKDLESFLCVARFNSIKRLLKKFDLLFYEGQKHVGSARTMPTNHEIAHMIACDDIDGRDLEGLLPADRVASIRKLGHVLRLNSKAIYASVNISNGAVVREYELNANDVVFRQGGYGVSNLSGNQQFISFVSRQKENYRSATSSRQIELISLVINEVHSMDPAGRFLQWDPWGGYYLEARLSKTIAKTRLALEETSVTAVKTREAAHGARPEIVGRVEQDHHVPYSSARVSPILSHRLLLVEPPASNTPTRNNGQKGVGMGMTQSPQQTKLAQEKDQSTKIGETKTPLEDERKLAASLLTKDSLNANDVVFGRGTDITNLPGNRRFRLYVKQRSKAYERAQYVEKSGIGRSIIDKIETMDPRGRFLHVDKQSGRYVEASFEEAMAKTMQRLREAVFSKRYGPGRQGTNAVRATMGSKKVRTCQQKSTMKEVARKPMSTTPVPVRGREPARLKRGDEIEASLPDSEATSSDDSILQPGSLISVYWPLDDEYYDAEVKYQHNKKYLIEYTLDKFIEWVDLDKHTFLVRERKY